MPRPFRLPSSLAAALALGTTLCACGGDAPAPRTSESAPAPSSTDAPAATPASTPAPGGGAASPWALATRPESGVEVIAAKESAPKESVVVVGRVREKLERRAGFSMIDRVVPYCGQTEKEGCPTPWDYCCIPSERVAAATVSVRVKGPDGRTVRVESLPELRNLDLVAVTGDLVKDGEDVVLEAKGWHVLERPAFDYEIDWPE
jgi:hypothetical protein